MEGKGVEQVSSVLKQLEQHPAFKKLSGNDAPSLEALQRLVYRNLFAVDSYSQLFYCDDEQRIKVINLKKLQHAETKGEGPHYLTLLGKPQLDFEIRELLFNERSNLLCVVGINACAVIEISDRARRELLTDTKREELECRTFPVGEYFHSTNPSISILRVLWHPFSHSHLAVLTSDNTLRLYDLSVNIEDPEQTFPLYALLPKPSFTSEDTSSYTPPFKVVDFCFGAKDVVGWGRFTIYFLMEDDAEIYALCPVLPYNCLLPEVVLTELKAITTEKLKAISKVYLRDEEEENANQLLEKRYKTQLQWLHAVRGQSAVGHIDEEYIDSGNFDKHGRRKHKKSPHGGHHNNSNNEGEEEGGWVITRKPASLQTPPLLQGPIDAVDDDFDDDKDGVCGLVSIPGSSPLVLARIFLNGLVEIFLSFDDLEPDWNRSNFFLEEDTGTGAALVLYERVNLNLPEFPLLPDPDDDESAALSSVLVPRLSIDPVLKDQLYVRHVAGVHSIKLSWFEKLHGICANEESGDPAASLADLPGSKVQVLLNTMPLGFKSRDIRKNVTETESAAQSLPGPPFGFQILNEPSMGHFAMVLTSTFKCQPIRLKDREVSLKQMMVLPPLPTLGEDRRGTEKEKEKEGEQQQQSLMQASFLQKIEPLLSKDLPRVPLIASPNPAALSYSSPECLAFLIRSCHTLQSGYVMHLHSLNEEVTNRVEVLEQLRARQSADLAKIQAKVVEQKETAAALRVKIEGMKNLQQALLERAELLMDMVQNQQPVLSSAEKKYHRELKEKNQRLTWYKNKIEKLRLQTEKLVQEKQQQQERRNLNDRMIESLKPILEDEMSLIARTVEGVKNLKLDVDTEFPDVQH